MTRFIKGAIVSAALLGACGCAPPPDALDIRELAVAQEGIRGQEVLVIGWLCVDDGVVLLSSDEGCAASGFLSEEHAYLEMKMDPAGDVDGMHGSRVLVSGRMIVPPRGAIVFTSGLLLGSAIEVTRVASFNGG
ncbi:MAG: hypothetical protein ACXIUZ_12155 [Lysobacteraceae bacterium]